MTQKTRNIEKQSEEKVLSVEGEIQTKKERKKESWSGQSGMAYKDFHRLDF